MSTRLLIRCRPRALNRPVFAGLGTGILLFTRPRQPMLCDAMVYSSHSKPPTERFDAEMAKQLAGGSMAGFCAGLLISFFSKTLVLLAGITMVVVQITARYGINLVKHLKLRERLNSSRIITLLRRNPTFKMTFALTFSLAALAKF